MHIKSQCTPNCCRKLIDSRFLTHFWNILIFQDILPLIEDLNNAGIRFVYFSAENELRSRVRHFFINCWICLIEPYCLNWLAQFLFSSPVKEGKFLPNFENKPTMQAIWMKISPGLLFIILWQSNSSIFCQYNAKEFVILIGPSGVQFRE